MVGAMPQPAMVIALRAETADTVATAEAEAEVAAAATASSTGGGNQHRSDRVAASFRLGRGRPRRNNITGRLDYRPTGPAVVVLAYPRVERPQL